MVSRRGGHVVEVGLSIASVAYGALLGTCLLGTLTRRATERGAMVGFAAGFATNMYLWLGTIAGKKVPFSGYVAVGSGLTFAVGYVFSLRLGGDTGPQTEIEQPK